MIVNFPGSKHQLTPAAQRIEVGYLGAREDEMVAMWMEAWMPVRAHFRSRSFIDQLGVPTAETMCAVVEHYIDSGATWFVSTATRPLSEVVGDAAASVPSMDHPAMSKMVKAAATNPFRPGTLSWARWRRRHDLSVEAPARILVAPDLRYRRIAKTLLANMVTTVTARQKQKVRTIVAKAFKAGREPGEIAQEIADVVGLNERWALAVENLRTSMVANGVHPRWVRSRAEKYSEELLRKRGVMIARTEMMVAFNAGQYEAWMVRQQSGALDAFVVTKWIETKPGACDVCVSYADPNATGQPRVVEGLDTPFEGTSLYPPFHPHCRCVVRYRLVPRPS